MLGSAHLSKAILAGEIWMDSTPDVMYKRIQVEIIHATPQFDLASVRLTYTPRVYQSLHRMQIAQTYAEPLRKSVEGQHDYPVRVQEALKLAYQRMYQDVFVDNRDAVSRTLREMLYSVPLAGFYFVARSGEELDRFTHILTPTGTRDPVMQETLKDFIDCTGCHTHTMLESTSSYAVLMPANSRGFNAPKERLIWQIARVGTSEFKTEHDVHAQARKQYFDLSDVLRFIHQPMNNTLSPQDLVEYHTWIGDLAVK